MESTQSNKPKKGSKLYVVSNFNNKLEYEIIGIWGYISEAFYFSLDEIGLEMANHRKFYQQVCDDLRNKPMEPVFIPKLAGKGQPQVKIQIHYYSREYIFRNEANKNLYLDFQKFNIEQTKKK